MDDTSAATDPPAPVETVYVVEEPPPAEMGVGTVEDPTVVALSDDDRALIGLASCLLALGVGARIVGSFGGS